MDNVQSSDKELDPYLYTTYLVGAMQHTVEKDDGGEKRANLDAELTGRNILAINPVKLEKSKTGIDVTTQVNKAQGWIMSGNWEKFREHAIAIWKGQTIVDQDSCEIRHIPGDIEYVLMSDWITFIYHKGDQPCGSFMECGVALEHNIPIYLITDIPKRELKQSLLQAIVCTKGEVFHSEREYLAYIDAHYLSTKK